ncbi:MAG: hypothetical protein D6725_07940 [Planctomycetota bacterium]|nr:MAG: hypothetical protein D6725_07940 [Planctomycetota bacterium]
MQQVGESLATPPEGSTEPGGPQGLNLMAGHAVANDGGGRRDVAVVGPFRACRDCSGGHRYRLQTVAARRREHQGSAALRAFEREAGTPVELGQPQSSSAVGTDEIDRCHAFGSVVGPRRGTRSGRTVRAAGSRSDGRAVTKRPPSSRASGGRRSGTPSGRQRLRSW